MEVPNHFAFFWGPLGVEFYQDGLKILLVSCPVLYQFVLVLRVAFYLLPDAINKSPEVAKVLSEEFLELLPGHRHGSVATSFVLKPSMGDRSTQKRSCKWNSVWPFGPGGFEVILTLLAKSIAVHMQIIIVKVRESGLERLFARFWVYLCSAWNLSL